MPIYEYECEACGRRSSALLPRFDAPDPACPRCGQPRLHRLVSTFATSRSDDGGEFDDSFDGDSDDDFGGDGGDDGYDDDW